LTVAGGQLSIIGGAFFNNGLVDIANIENSATGGAAISVQGEGNATITGSTFYHNSVSCSSPQCSPQGGAVYASTDSSLVVIGSLFAYNAVSGPNAEALGGAISSIGSATTVLECVFEGNTVSSAGTSRIGGGAISSKLLVTVERSLFVNNSAFSVQGTAFGGALALMSGGVVLSSTFTNNSALGQASASCPCYQRTPF